MIHTWDAGKNRRNVARHGVSFKDAIGIFEGPTLERIDNRFDYSEVRIYSGLVSGIEITVVYTDVSHDERRIISAWRAERHEREAYWKNIG
jgi:hypothetical protein